MIVTKKKCYSAVYSTRDFSVASDDILYLSSYLLFAEIFFKNHYKDEFSPWDEYKHGSEEQSETLEKLDC